MRAALVAAPVQQHAVHVDAAPEFGADLTVYGEQYVIGLHGSADADVRGFVSKARRIGAELAGALQVHRLGIEGARAHHHAIELQQQCVVLRELRQWSDEFSVLVETGAVRDLEPRRHGVCAHVDDRSI